MQKGELVYGTLETFSSRKFKSRGIARVGEKTAFLPTSSRGILQQDGATIRSCPNGDRYKRIRKGARIAMRVVPSGEDLHAIEWAPVVKK